MSEKKIQLEQINLPKSQPESQVEPFESAKQMLAIATLGTCLLLGVLGAFLFDGQSWGLNIALFTWLLVGSLMFLRKLGQQPLRYSQYALVASGLFFAVTFVWRDSYVLNSLSLLGILLTVNLAFTLGTRQQLLRFDVSEAFADFFSSTRYGIASYSGLINRDIQWGKVKQRWGNFGRAILRGVIITIPLLMVFGYLLTASDARFEEEVHGWLDWGMEPKAVARYLVTFILCGWIAAALLRGSVLNQGLVTPERQPFPTWTLSSVEIVMMLGAINILFLSFIAVQFTYFFGGDTLVQSPEGPTYADYARRGFFQLLTLAVLVITLLLLTHWLYKPSTQTEKRLYPFLAAMMVLMTMVIEASAAHRMYLYIHAYGLTELRFYTSVFMAWLVVLFVWFSVTVLREQRAFFTFGAMLTAIVFIGVLHFVNPDARIAEVNLAHLQSGQQKVAAYVTSLSADAVPTLLTARSDLEKSHRCELWQRLQSHPVLQASDDWRYWHWARSQARAALLSPVSKPDCKVKALKVTDAPKSNTN